MHSGSCSTRLSIFINTKDSQAKHMKISDQVPCHWKNKNKLALYPESPYLWTIRSSWDSSSILTLILFWVGEKINIHKFRPRNIISTPEFRAPDGQTTASYLFAISHQKISAQQLNELLFFILFKNPNLFLYFQVKIVSM